MEQQLEYRMKKERRERVRKDARTVEEQREKERGIASARAMHRATRERVSERGAMEPERDGRRAEGESERRERKEGARSCGTLSFRSGGTS